MIDRRTVEHIAKISRLNLTEEEIDKFSKDISDILSTFSLIREVDTTDVKPSFQPEEIKNVTREDAEERCLTQEEALSNTDQKEDKFFKGPRSV